VTRSESCRPIRGLYAIADTALLGDRLLEAARAALRGGVRLLQYRDKRGTPGQRLRQASALLACCQRHDAILIVNDDTGLAAAIGADGVHLGCGDGEVAQARTLLGGNALIGRSCYDRLELAVAAELEGADYVAFGSFFPSHTKPQAVPAPIGLLAEARERLSLPIVAIGGITPDNGAALLAAGADALAVIHGLFGQPDIEAAARAFTGIFSPQRHRGRRDS